MPTRPLASCLVALPLVASLGAQCNLVADLQTQVLSVNSSNPTGQTVGPGGTTIHNFVKLGADVYFNAKTEATGIELWRTDGTAAGTTLVKDINPGSADGTPYGLFAANGLLFFSANDGTHGQELWRSDGTAAGTWMVADIKSGSSGSGPGHFARLGSEVFFSAAQNAVVTLWRSNGTAAGTTAMLDSTLNWVRSPQYLRTNSNGTEIYFRSTPVGSYPRLYKTNGTTAGTGPVPLAPLVNIGHATEFTNVNGVTIFRAQYTLQGVPGGSGEELCRTDGTQAGTGLVMDINPGSSSSGPDLSRTAIIGNEAYFSADDGTNSRQLWKTNGTTAGTVRIGNGTAGSWPQDLHRHGSTLFFRAAHSGFNDTELYRYAGGSISLVRDIFPGTSGSSPRDFASLAGGVVFTAYEPGTGRELWFSNGSSAGTNVVRDISPGTTSTVIDWVTQVGPGRVVFSCWEPNHGRELWTSDGTAAGTVLLMDIDPVVLNYGSGPNDLASIDGREMLFAAHTQAGGFQTWKVDVQGNPQVLAPPVPGSQGNTKHFTPCWLGDRWRTFFVKSVTFSADELWVTDGSSAGTVMLASFPVSWPSPAIYHLTRSGDRVFFGAYDNASGIELWSSDGTVAGTQMVADIAAGATGSITANSEFVASGDHLFFTADDGSHGVELWSSDGTTTGTQLVRDIEPGAIGSTPMHLTDCGGKLAFAATTSANGEEPWTSDGTVPGTFMLLDIAFLSGSSWPQEFTYSGGITLFQATNTAVGAELWQTNLLPGGTSFVKDIYPGTLGSNLQEMVADDSGRAYFRASNNGFNVELWTSDGTAAGTVMVADIMPGISGSSPEELTVVGDRVYFSAATSTHGRELWSSDGTAAGTAMVQDIRVGTGSSAPVELTLNAGWLYFGADDGLVGHELWVLPTPGASAQRLGDGCAPLFPRLAATAPVLGTTMDLLGTRAPSVFGAVVMGLPTPTPTIMPFSLGCATWVNTAAWFQMASVPTPPNWTLPVALPNAPGMVGLALIMQSLFFVPSTLSITASNGVRLTLDF